MTRFAPLTAFAALALLVGCSGSSDPSDQGGAGAGAPATTGAGNGSTTGDMTGGTGGGGGAWDPGGPVTSYHAKMGPLPVALGGEDTQCITFHLDNPDTVYVRRFSTELLPGSHHMILYRSTETEENLTPTDCGGFSGLLEGDDPIFIAQQAHTELELPTDEDGKPVALELDAHQMVRVELHYFNTTQTPLMVSGDIQLDTVPLSVAVTTSEIAFWGTENIQIDPLSSADTGVLFQRGIPNTHAFAITTHEHHLGTEMRVWFGQGTQASSTTALVDSHDWQDPPLGLFSPPISYGPAPDGEVLSTDGLAFECNWQNPTTNTVSFGESINDEMCFLWQYYYPSQGFQACVDGICGASF
jgi:hypothetical protein